MNIEKCMKRKCKQCKKYKSCFEKDNTLIIKEKINKIDKEIRYEKKKS